MKKTLLTTLAISAFWAVTLAQEALEVDPVVTYVEGSISSSDIGSHTDVTNMTDDTLRLLWTRNIISMQQGWWNWICDPNLCYLPEVGVCPPSKFITIAPGETIDMQVHVRPFGVQGEAEIHVVLYDMSDPDEILGTVKAVIAAGTTSVTDVDKSSVRIYPNPTTAEFQLANGANVDQIVVYSLVGNKLLEFEAKNSTRFDVSSLPQGIYLVRMLDDEQQVLKTVRLSKR